MLSSILTSAAAASGAEISVHVTGQYDSIVSKNNSSGSNSYTGTDSTHSSGNGSLLSSTRTSMTLSPDASTATLQSSQDASADYKPKAVKTSAVGHATSASLAYGIDKMAAGSSKVKSGWQPSVYTWHWLVGALLLWIATAANITGLIMANNLFYSVPIADNELASLEVSSYSHVYICLYCMCMWCLGIA